MELQVIYCGNKVIRKVITILAYTVGEAVMPPLIEVTSPNPIYWLLSYKSFLDTINEPVCVYGTGPAAAWVGNILGSKVTCYLDDDESRHGRI